MNARSHRAAWLALLLTAGAGQAQSDAQTPTTPTLSPGPDITGLWLVQDPGSGDWEQFFHHSQGDADVLPEWITYFEEQRARERVQPANTIPQTPDCPQGNVARMMASSPGIVIVSARGEILMGQEAAKGRVIYTDGRPLPDTTAPGFEPSGFGHSVGRWEGNMLIVDTVGFPPRMCDNRRPIQDIPGRGRAKETTRLTEWYRLTSPGTLVAEFTWEDPTVFRKPWKYTYTYTLVPEGLPIEPNPDTESDPTLERQPAGSPAAR